jgi:SAM-dependent methyltransferase
MTDPARCLPEVDYGRMIDGLNRVHYEGETSFYGQATLRPEEEALLRRAPTGSPIIDVGCGAGRVTAPADRSGLRAVGIDINLAALRAARGNNPGLTVASGRMDALPFPNLAFKQVWCLRFSFNALPTTGERVRTLKELWRVCDVGGDVVLEAFNWYFPGRFGLLRVANLLDILARRLRWYGQGSSGSLPLPSRDLIYLASKANTAPPGYAHLTTVQELRDLAATAGIEQSMRVTDQAGVLSGTYRKVRGHHRGYATWVVFRKPPNAPDEGSQQ